MKLLREAHREENLDGVMCRSLLSVDWQGYLYDCDFNQQLRLPIRDAATPRAHLRAHLRVRAGRRADPRRRPLLRLHGRPGFELRRRAGRLRRTAMTATQGLFFWGFLVVFGLVMFVLAPRSRDEAGFFRGRDARGRAPSQFALTMSIFIAWIFAKSVTNSANLGATYGIVGGLAYASYWLSIPVAGFVIHRLRTRGHGRAGAARCPVLQRRLQLVRRGRRGLRGGEPPGAAAPRDQVGGCRVGVVHGDADSLADWRFDVASLDDPRLAGDWHRTSTPPRPTCSPAPTPACRPCARSTSAARRRWRTTARPACRTSMVISAAWSRASAARLRRIRRCTNCAWPARSSRCCRCATTPRAGRRSSWRNGRRGRQPGCRTSSASATGRASRPSRLSALGSQVDPAPPGDLNPHGGAGRAGPDLGALRSPQSG